MDVGSVFEVKKEIPIKFGSIRKHRKQLVTSMCLSAPASANRFPLRTYDSYDIPDMETISTSREAARRSTSIRAQIPVRITVIEGS